jgi:hypothetical protein
VPRSKRLEVLRESHDIATVEYPDERKMYKALDKGFTGQE